MDRSPAPMNGAILQFRGLTKWMERRSSVPMIEWAPYGPSAVMLRFADHVGEDAFLRSRAILAEMERHPPVGLIECVPGFTTVLLRFDTTQIGDLHWLGNYLVSQLQDLSPADFARSPIKEIPASYRGDDLETLAEEKEMSVREIIELHSAPIYRVHLIGFSPGFPYLGELNPKLHTPRRAVPRPRVVAGSIAIGGEHTGIYSVDSPGGWQIIGHTNLPMFAREKLSATSKPGDLFLLRAGDRVRFVPVNESAHAR